HRKVNFHDDLFRINAAFGEPVQWLPDSKTLLCQVIPKREDAPKAGNAPNGPTVQESYGKNAPVRTFQDLLKNPEDEKLFDYYATSQLIKVDTKSGNWDRIGKPAIFSMIEPSPNGEYLLVARIQRPYSYLFPSSAFPKEVEIWNMKGELVHKVASLPLADQ